MMLTTCLLALAALGPGETAETGESHVLVRVKSLEMKGVEWRGEAGAKLQACARQGTATIWTTDRATGAAIAKAAVKVIDTPNVTTVPGAPASIVDEVNRNYVAEVVRHPEEAVPFEPNIQTVHDGWRGTLTCRPLDQGVLATVRIDANQFMAFHPVDTKDTFRVAGSPEEHSFKAQYQVPEVATAHVAGDWLIPKEGCLVIAFGVHTVTKSDGKLIFGSGPHSLESKHEKPVAVERVLLIQAEPFSAEPAPVAAAHPRLTAAPAPGFPIDMTLPRLQPYPNMVSTVVRDDTVSQVTHIQPDAKGTKSKPGNENMIAVAVSLATPTNLPVIQPITPKIPSRAMPQPYTADGKKVELPALPDNALEPVSSSDESDVPRPSPQSIHVVREDAWKSLTGITLSGLSQKDAAAALLSLLGGRHDDELAPIDDEVKTTSATSNESPERTGVSRISLGGGFVLEVPAKYIPRASENCDD